MKNRKKPVVIEAMQWTGLNPTEIKCFCGDSAKIEIYDAAWQVGVAAPVVDITIKTLEGNMNASIGDYIIQGVNGEFYPCKPDIFEKTYEPVLESKDKIVQEEHYNEMVWTNTLTDRIRRDECLCLDCAKMSKDKEKNCPIAQQLYELCCKENIAFMMTRCPKWTPFPF